MCTASLDEWKKREEHFKMGKLNLFKTKSIQQLHAEAFDNSHGLRRALSANNLVALGVGSIVGAGIFVLTGQVAAEYAGPAILISFLISGVACGIAGLCYAEFASMIPVTGSAYTYAYATMGELLAWIIGWDLMLEYLFSASTVCVGWSGYVVSFLNDFNITIPPQLTVATGTRLVLVPGEGWQSITSQLTSHLQSMQIDVASLPVVTGIVNLPAVIIVFLSTILLIVGIKESAGYNNLMVIIKIAIILIFVGVGFAFVNMDNLKPFIPENTGEFGHFGWSGILRGAGVIFFAYIGFDAASTVAQEAKNPQRDMPRGILGSLGISSLLYLLVAFVLVGSVSYHMLNVPDPIAVAVNSMGESMFWLRPVIKLGAIAGLSSVILVTYMSQPRIFYSMSRDGLLPPVFAKVHPKYKTPYISTIVTGLAGMVLAGMLPIDVLGELVSIGTLLAFAIVCVGIIILRKTRPDVHRPFKIPWVPFLPALGAAVCLLQMAFLPLDTWLRLLVWMAIGIVLYFVYGIKHSKLRKMG